jgi:hypothetical protein
MAVMLVILLLDKNADIESKGNSSQTSLSWAAVKNPATPILSF